MVDLQWLGYAILGTELLATVDAWFYADCVVCREAKFSNRKQMRTAAAFGTLSPGRQ